MLCLTENIALCIEWAVHNGMYSTKLEALLLTQIPNEKSLV